MNNTSPQSNIFNKTDKDLTIILYRNDPEYIDILLQYLYAAKIVETEKVSFPNLNFLNNTNVEENDIRAIFWQILVLKFGSYIKNPKHGWIWVAELDTCIKYVEEIQKAIMTMKENYH